MESLAQGIVTDGATLLSVVCDTAIEAAVDTAFRTVESDLGAPNVLIYNAGRFVRGGLLETSPEDFAEAWRVNCLGAFLCARRAAPVMAASAAASRRAKAPGQAGPGRPTGREGSTPGR